MQSSGPPLSLLLICFLEHGVPTAAVTGGIASDSPSMSASQRDIISLHYSGVVSH
jgi:hypothetical protein